MINGQRIWKPHIEQHRITSGTQLGEIKRLERKHVVKKKKTRKKYLN